MDGNLMGDIHKDLLQEIRERERGIWQIWTILISALSIWALAFGKYLSKYSITKALALGVELGEHSTTSEYIWLFVGVSLFVLILLSWGVGIVYTFGYHYRMFQTTLYKIENEQCLTERIIPPAWDPCSQFWFSTGQEFQDCLDNKRIQDGLRSKFKCNGLQLSENAYVLIEKRSKEWLIKNDNEMYFVRKEKDKLNIYSGKKPELPDLYKVHLCAFHCAIALVLVVLSLAVISEKLCLRYNIPVMLMATLFSVVPCICSWICSRSKLRQLCRKMAQRHE
jgi:hypothetical protein